jgi:hypothetical protein
VAQINPLYKGTEVVTRTPLSQAIQTIGVNPSDKWVTDYIQAENFATLNGKDSLTGTYTYPQLELWDQLNLQGQQKIYNRYAHMGFSFDRNVNKITPPQLSQATPDQFNVLIEPCNDFFKKNNVSYLITTVKFEIGAAPCASLVKSVSYPTVVFYIYHLTS